MYAAVRTRTPSPVAPPRQHTADLHEAGALRHTLLQQQLETQTLRAHNYELHAEVQEAAALRHAVLLQSLEMQALQAHNHELQTQMVDLKLHIQLLELKEKLQRQLSESCGHGDPCAAVTDSDTAMSSGGAGLLQEAQGQRQGARARRRLRAAALARSSQLTADDWEVTAADPTPLVAWAPEAEEASLCQSALPSEPSSQVRDDMSMPPKASPAEDQTQFDVLAPVSPPMQQLELGSWDCTAYGNTPADAVQNMIDDVVVLPSHIRETVMRLPTLAFSGSEILLRGMKSLLGFLQTSDSAVHFLFGILILGQFLDRVPKWPQFQTYLAELFRFKIGASTDLPLGGLLKVFVLVLTGRLKSRAYFKAVGKREVTMAALIKKALSKRGL